MGQLDKTHRETCLAPRTGEPKATSLRPMPEVAP
jgi:hypothetical protein